MPTRSARARALALVLSLLALGGCAHDVDARYPSTPDEATGQVELVFTAVASSVTVVVNGALVVHGARTERVVISGVPTGYAEVSVAAGTGEKQVRVWVEAERTTTVPLGAADEAPLSAVRAFAMSLATVALYALLR